VPKEEKKERKEAENFGVRQPAMSDDVVQCRLSSARKIRSEGSELP